MKRNRWVFVCVRERFLLRPTHVRRKANSSCAREPCMGAGKQTSWAEVGRGSEGAMYVVRDMQVPRAESRVKRRASILSGRWCNPHVPFSELSLPLPPRMLHPPARTWETQFIIPSIIDFVSCHRNVHLQPVACPTCILHSSSLYNFWLEDTRKSQKAWLKSVCLWEATKELCCIIHSVSGTYKYMHPDHALILSITLFNVRGS